MPGDELHEEATGPANAPGAHRGRTGPRHAAPRKPLLTRLHVPAGKAVAMAAMPSAVLMSMGITPQLAYAKPLPKNPFREGPCVSQQDKAEEEARKEAEAERKAEEARKRAEAERESAEEEKPETSGGRETADGGTSGGASGETSGGDASGGTGASGGTSGGGSAEPSPEPSPSGEDGSGGGLLGGLLGGLGDTLRGGDEEADAQAEPEPSQTPGATAEDSAGPVGDAVDEVEQGLEDTAGKVEEGVDGVTDELPAPSPSAGEPSSGDDAADDAAEGTTGEDGKRAFPCVEEKSVAGEDERTPAVLPNQPWTLHASSLGLHGLSYEGVVNVRTADGDSKQALKFTAKSVDIGDLHQIVDGPDGLKYHVEAAAGSTSTIRDGQVTMYTERLEGKLFGLIPIVFDPEHQPPLDLPEVYFTDVTVKQAGQFGGTLTVPGLTSTISAG